MDLEYVMEADKQVESGNTLQQKYMKKEMDDLTTLDCLEYEEEVQNLGEGWKQIALHIWCVNICVETVASVVILVVVIDTRYYSSMDS